MDRLEIGVAMFVGVLVMISLRMPVGGAMLLVGGVGYAAISGWDPLLASLKTMTYSKFADYPFSVIPLFLLMGEFASRGGISKQLYAATRAWFGHRSGGLAVATIGGCAAFGAVCGSSLATAATMSQVALPEMRRHGYSPALSTGTLAAGGTLGILIPPSIILVIYSIYTEQSVGALFVAAVIPGLLAVFQYVLVVRLYARLRPNAAPRSEKASWADRRRKTMEVGPVAALFLLIVVGIYGGWFSPTEGAGIGAFLTLLLAIFRGGLRWEGVSESILAAGATTAMMFLIILSAELFSAALASSRLPIEVAETVAGSGLSPYTILCLILLLYFVLGCFMESLAMVLLTLPVFVPLIVSLDFGMSQDAALVWFGILVLICVEVGMASPPFGLNLFLINSLAKDVPMRETYRGVIGFCMMDLLRVLLLVAFPVLALWLPGLR